MTEVCELWSDGELAALVLGTVGLSAVAVLGVILVCVWLAQRRLLAVRRCSVTNEAPVAGERPARARYVECAYQCTLQQTRDVCYTVGPDPAMTSQPLRKTGTER